MQSYHIDDKVNNYLKLNDNNTADLPEIAQFFIW